MRARREKLPSRIIQFDARDDPEGSLLLIDANTEPYVHVYTDVKLFLSSPHPETRTVKIATITGVGSSALGSAALAWDISTALGKPVLAIVPGYGMADVILQAFGGWFGFGLYDVPLAKDVGMSNAYARIIGVRTGSVTESEFKAFLDRFAPWQALVAVYLVYAGWRPGARYESRHALRRR